MVAFCFEVCRVINRATRIRVSAYVCVRQYVCAYGIMVDMSPNSLLAMANLIFAATCWTWNLISLVINCNRVGIRFNVPIGWACACSIAVLCCAVQCVYFWSGCVCMFCQCVWLRVWHFICQVNNVNMKCSVRQIDFIICLIASGVWSFPRHPQ